jgi:polyhydroxybutyrate depolymerase
MPIWTLFLSLFAISLSPYPVQADKAESNPDRRPYVLQVPESYEIGKKLPLVLILHGYTGNMFQTEGIFRMKSLLKHQKIIFVTPEGTRDLRSNAFWNATPSCCNFFSSKVDDVSYLNKVIDEVSSKYSVDSNQIYVLGESNGGFMATLLACSLSSKIAAFVNIAGSGWTDRKLCHPKHPVSALFIHSSSDDVIKYEGGNLFDAFGNQWDLKIRPSDYPSVQMTAQNWAKWNKCQDKPNQSSAGRSIQKWEGCSSGGAVESWTFSNSPHIIHFSDEELEAIWSFLKLHSMASNPEKNRKHVRPQL